jgi:hypothetical protein
MAKTDLVQYDETDSGNTDISGIGLSDNTPIDQLDNIPRAQMGALARFTGADTIAAASTTDLGTVPGQYVDITGTTTIAGLGTIRGGILKFVRFAGVLTLTYNGTSLILPGAANIVTAAGDTGIFVSKGSGNWECLAYNRATGLPSNAAAKLDTRRNRIVNGDMRLSQENSTTPGTTNGFFPADQWAQYRVTSAGTLTAAQVALVTPAGAPNRLRATVTVADATLAAGEYWTLSQNLEGSNVADAQYGSAAAKNMVLRFGFKGPAGTYAVALHNSAANRSYVALFTISAPQANTDTVQTFSIAGDTTGTWLTADGVVGITLDIVLAAGTTFQGAVGWQSGLILGTSAISNGMATGSAVFELFDVGLRLDPDSIGLYGQYEVGPVDAVYRSERYAKRLAALTLGLTAGAVNLSNGTYVMPVSMAKAPTLSAATYAISAGSAGTVSISAATAENVRFENSAGNWSAQNLVSVSGMLIARLT